MKAAPLVCILACLCACFACDDDTSPKTSQRQLLIGVWRAQRVAINGQEDYVTDYSDFRLTLNADGSFRWQDPSANTLPDGTPGNALSGQWTYDQQTRVISLGETLFPTVIFLRQGQLLLELSVDDFKLEASTFDIALVSP